MEGHNAKEPPKGEPSADPSQQPSAENRANGGKGGTSVATKRPERGSSFGPGEKGDKDKAGDKPPATPQEHPGSRKIVIRTGEVVREGATGARGGAERVAGQQ